jgi:anthranilate 3-monooxygenase (FAD)/4-hydroxyphenylacetate 3-monooxygenase
MTESRTAPGVPRSTSFLIPRFAHDLRARFVGHRAFAESAFGLAGRSPDYGNAMLTGLAASSAFFSTANERFGANLVRYFEDVRENDRYVVFAVVSPQRDRSKALNTDADDEVLLRVTGETEAGIVVSGARMIATQAPIADELFIYSVPGHKPGDEAYASMFAIPVDTPGVRQICREPLSNGDGRTAEHPLSSRFEELDSMVVFDNVVVPWDRVFLYRDVTRANTMFGEANFMIFGTAQEVIRGLVKMQFITGIAIALARATKTDAFLHVQEMLGECLQRIETVRACLVTAEVEASVGADGIVRPAWEPLRTALTLMPRFYPRMAEIVQLLGGGGLIMMPSSDDFTSGASADIERYFRGSGTTDAIDRVLLYKLAADLVAHGFGSRITQYERYYVGDPVRLTASIYTSFDTAKPEALVRAALAEPTVQPPER